MQTWPGEPSPGADAARCADSTKLLSGSLETNVIVWDLVKGTDARIVLKNTHIGGVNAVLFLSDNTFVTAGADCCVRRWSL